MTIKTSPATYPSRITASNTIERHSAPLDARSIVALEFASFLAYRHARLKVPPAVLIRRALALLADHMSNLEGPELAGEMHRIREAGKGSGSALTLTQARARIEEHQRAPGAQAMSHWHDALRSTQENREGREMLARLEAVMAERFPDDEAGA